MRMRIWRSYWRAKRAAARRRKSSDGEEVITSGRLGAAVYAWTFLVLSLRRKRQCQQRLLLDFMSLGAAAGWTRAGAALHGKHVTFPCNALQTRKHIEQRSHVGRLFLHPDDIAFVAVAREFSGQFFLRKRIQLLHEYDSG